MSYRPYYISQFKAAFTNAGIEVTEIDEETGDRQDLEITIITKDDDGTEHAEGLYFTLDGLGIFTRHDFTGSRTWGHANEVSATVKRAFEKGAKWLNRDGLGEF